MSVPCSRESSASMARSCSSYLMEAGSISPVTKACRKSATSSARSGSISPFDTPRATRPGMKWRRTFGQRSSKSIAPGQTPPSTSPSSNRSRARARPSLYQLASNLLIGGDSVTQFGKRTPCDHQDAFLRVGRVGRSWSTEPWFVLLVHLFMVNASGDRVRAGAQDN